MCTNASTYLVVKKKFVSQIVLEIFRSNFFFIPLHTCTLIYLAAAHVIAFFKAIAQIAVVKLYEGLLPMIMYMYLLAARLLRHNNVTRTLS